MCFITGSALAAVAAGTTAAETASPFLVAGAAAAAPAAATAGSFLPWLSGGASILGAGASAAGALSRGGANAELASYQAEVARNNSIAAGYAADSTEQAGLRSAEIKQQGNAAREAHVRAAIGASGVDVNTGSAADVQAGEKSIDTTDVATVLSNAALRSYGYRSQSTNIASEVPLYSAEAGYDTSAGALSATGSLLSSASQLPFKFGTA